MAPYSIPCPLCLCKIYGRQKVLKCSGFCCLKYHLDCYGLLSDQSLEGSGVIIDNGANFGGDFVCEYCRACYGQNTLTLNESYGSYLEPNKFDFSVSSIGGSSEHVSGMMSSLCSLCSKIILDSSIAIVCAGQCKRSFHLSCLRLSKVDAAIFLDIGSGFYYCCDCNNISLEKESLGAESDTLSDYVLPFFSNPLTVDSYGGSNPLTVDGYGGSVDTFKEFSEDDYNLISANSYNSNALDALVEPNKLDSILLMNNDFNTVDGFKASCSLFPQISSSYINKDVVVSLDIDKDACRDVQHIISACPHELNESDALIDSNISFDLDSVSLINNSDNDIRVFKENNSVTNLDKDVDIDDIVVTLASNPDDFTMEILQELSLQQIHSLIIKMSQQYSNKSNSTTNVGTQCNLLYNCEFSNGDFLPSSLCDSSAKVEFDLDDVSMTTLKYDREIRSEIFNGVIDDINISPIHSGIVTNKSADDEIGNNCGIGSDCSRIITDGPSSPFRVDNNCHTKLISHDDKFDVFSSLTDKKHFDNMVCGEIGSVCNNDQITQKIVCDKEKITMNHNFSNLDSPRFFKTRIFRRSRFSKFSHIPTNNESNCKKSEGLFQHNKEKSYFNYRVKSSDFHYKGKYNYSHSNFNSKTAFYNGSNLFLQNRSVKMTDVNNQNKYHSRNLLREVDCYKDQIVGVNKSEGKYYSRSLSNIPVDMTYNRYFLSNMPVGISAKDIKLFLENNLQTNIVCYKINMNNSGSSCFYISVPVHKHNEIISPNLWPCGASISFFYGSLASSLRF